MMTLGGTSTAWADAKTLPYSYGFEDYNLAADGWTTQNPSGKNSGEFQIAGAAKKTGSYGFRFSSYSTNGENTQYLISPELNAPNGVIVSFYYAASSTSGIEKFKVGYSTSDTDIANFTWGDEISYKSTSWKEYNNTFPAGTKYIAIYYYANYQYRLYVDDFSFEGVASGPALSVADGTTKLTTGYSYNFGLATSSDTKTFTLSNPGTESITLNIAATNGFGVSPANTTIAAKGEETLTVTMADATATGAVIITPVENVDPFTINVSGTIMDPNKMFVDFANGEWPDNWTGKTSWNVTSGYAYNTVTSSYSDATDIITPAITCQDGDYMYFKVKKYDTSSSWSTATLTVYTTSDLEWSSYETYNLDSSIGREWATLSIPLSSTVKYVCFRARNIAITEIYGGELPNVPNMKVTQPASLNFGIVDKDAAAPTKTFTIANTGKATLEGINVTSGNAAFAIANAPTTLAAGASQEVTITMATGTAGALSSLITVSATDMPDATFTVTGCVKPAGMPVEDFASGLPANWTNASWTFANGEATGKSSSAYVFLPVQRLS